MRYAHFLMILAVVLLLGVQYVPAVSGYSSNQNAIIGALSSNACSPISASSQVYVSTTLITSTGADAYSVQMNSYAAPNSQSINFMQYNFGIGYYGNVYGSVQYFAGSQGVVLNLNTGTLDSLAGNALVMGGSQFQTAVISNSNNNIYQAGYSFYDSYKGNWYSGTINIPSSYQVPLYSWQLNIVGENQQYPSVTFVQGSGSITYSSSVALNYYPLLLGCTQGPQTGTGETSNIVYGSPSTSNGQVIQTF